MTTDDIRWKQRFSNFLKALILLEEAVQLKSQRTLTVLESQGFIQRFEFTHELAWNVLKDYLEYQGQIFITGSRDATREAFNKNLIEDGETWMEMIKSRNLSSHIYDGEIMDGLVEKIINSYYPLFVTFRDKMNKLMEQNN
ncbi:MAG: nucleotidyltransferase substrate binding protein [Planctomycetaceae bacterium]|jgi:nucleotidyltransferase substrate binding protein (TIGR01987 family)|nr:nucleotidyltransferase substrate binding protein [Planctomycetaceae bacterium]